MLDIVSSLLLDEDSASSEHKNDKDNHNANFSSNNNQLPNVSNIKGADIN